MQPENPGACSVPKRCSSPVLPYPLLPRFTRVPATACAQLLPQAEAAREARLRGPHPFPLTRLISIFHRLWASAAPLESDAAVYGGKGLSYAAGGTVYGEEQDVLDVDLVTGFAGGRTGVEVGWRLVGSLRLVRKIS